MISRKLTEHPDYNEFFSKANKAHSPPRADLTPEELENVLGVTIPLRPSLTNRAKSMIGMKTLPQYDERAVRIARLIAQSNLDSITKKNKKHEEDNAMRREIANKEEAAKIQQKENELAIQRRQAASEAAAEAHRERKEQLPNPITAQHTRDAKRNYQDWRVAADRSATTDAFVPHGYTYVDNSLKRDGARQDLIALEARYAAQPQKEHEWRMNAWFNELDLRNRRRGGKSKRVKSKRNKRTKRRNARK